MKNNWFPTVHVFLWTNKICGQSEISCFPSHSLLSFGIHVVDDCHRSMMSIVVVDRRFFMNKQNMWTVGNQLFFITLTLVVLDPCCWWLSSFDDVDRGRWSSFFYEQTKYVDSRKPVGFHYTHSSRFGSMLLMIVIVRWCRSWSLIVVFRWTNKIRGQSEISCFFRLSTYDVDRGRWSSFFYEQTKYVDSRKSVVFHHTHSFVLDPCCWWLSSFDDVDRGRWSSFFYEQTKYVDSRKSVVFHHTHSCRFGSMLLMIVIVRWCRSWSLIVVFLWTNKICGQSEISSDCPRILFVHRGRWSSFFYEQTKYVDSRKSVVFHHTHSCRFGSMLLMIVIVRWCRSWSLIVVFLWTNKICGQSETSWFPLHSLFSIWIHVVDDCHRSMMSIVVVDRRFSMNEQNTWTVGNQLFSITLTLVVWDPCCWWLSSFDDVDRGRWSSFFYKRTKYVGSRKPVVFHHTHSCRLGSMLLMIVIVRWCRSWSLIVVFL